MSCSSVIPLCLKIVKFNHFPFWILVGKKYKTSISHKWVCQLIRNSVCNLYGGCWSSFWSESQTCESLISNFAVTVLANLCALCVIFATEYMLKGILKNRFLHWTPPPPQTTQNNKKSKTFQLNTSMKTLVWSTCLSTLSSRHHLIYSQIRRMICSYCCVFLLCVCVLTVIPLFLHPSIHPNKIQCSHFSSSALWSKPVQICALWIQLWFLQVSNNQFFLLLSYLAV